MSTLFSRDDIEANFNLRLNHTKKRIVLWYETHRFHTKYLAFGLLILMVAVVFKNTQNTIPSSTTIVIDEETYSPIVLKPLLRSIENKRTELLQVKESLYNRIAQQKNLEDIELQVRSFLKEEEQICIHARHYDIPYDIIFFHNLTMINPHVKQESKTTEFQKEDALDGTTKHAKRALWLEITYLGIDLVRKPIRLYGPQAFCFAHYEF